MISKLLKFSPLLLCLLTLPISSCSMVKKNNYDNKVNISFNSYKSFLNFFSSPSFTDLISDKKTKDYTKFFATETYDDDIGWKIMSTDLMMVLTAGDLCSILLSSIPTTILVYQLYPHLSTKYINNINVDVERKFDSVNKKYIFSVNNFRIDWNDYDDNKISYLLYKTNEDIFDISLQIMEIEHVGLLLDSKFWNNNWNGNNEDVDNSKIFHLEEEIDTGNIISEDNQIFEGLSPIANASSIFGNDVFPKKNAIG